MKRSLKPLLLIPTLLLTGCNFKYNYVIKGVTGAGDVGGDIWQDDSGVDDSGTYNIKIWVDERIAEITQSQIASFTSAYGGKYTINANIEPMGEANAASAMLQDVQEGADIFCFAQDQLARLKVAGAITKITGSLNTYLKEKNSHESVEAASIGQNLYAFPATSDNGYFLYYDKSIISEEQTKNMTSLLNALRAAGKNLNFSARADGFYAASYFLGAGCVNTWTIDEDSGKFIRYNDTFGEAPLGKLAAKGIKEIADSSVVATRSMYTNTAGAVISGIWEYSAIKAALGDNLGCTDLPSYTVEGQTFHLGSYDGYKLMGVKPQVDSKKASVCRKLAQFLTNNASQTERFNIAGWGPTHNETSQLDSVIAHPGLAALRKQHEYATQQSQAPGAWFATLSSVATAITTTSTDAEIDSTLALYNATLPDLLSED